MLGVQTLGPVMPRRVAEDEASTEGGSQATRFAPAAHWGMDETCQPAEEVIEPSVTTAELDDSANLERDAWVVLLSVPGLGPISFGALLAAFGSARAVLEGATAPDGPARLLATLAEAAADADRVPEAGLFDACAATDDEEAAAPGGASRGRRRPAIGPDLAARICDVAAGGVAQVERVRALGLTVVTLEEPSYPARLRQVELPPPLLFVRGSVAALDARHAVAVVGTRRPTDKGRLIAGWIGSAIARTGAVVVSGLAVGIDGVAHAAVVAEGGAHRGGPGRRTREAVPAGARAPGGSDRRGRRGRRVGADARQRLRVGAAFRGAIGSSAACRTRPSSSKPVAEAGPSSPPDGRWSRAGNASSCPVRSTHRPVPAATPSCAASPARLASSPVSPS